MKQNKGFSVIGTLLIVLGVIVVGGIGYFFLNPGALPKEAGDAAEQEADAVADGAEKITIEWQFTDAGEIDGYPYTNVAVFINGGINEIGKFMGSCAEVGATGGIDGTGLIPGELSAVQCWFAGGGDEIGVFANEAGGVDIMVGQLGEGADGAGMFRGNFEVRNSLVF